MNTFVEINEISPVKQKSKANNDEYPRAVGSLVSSKAKGSEVIRLRKFYVVKGKKEESLMISQQGGWGKMTTEGINLLKKIDGLTSLEAQKALGVGSDLIENFLQDPIRWGIVSIPGQKPPKLLSKNYNTDFSLLVVKITNKCNISCNYCYNSGVDGRENLTEEKGKEMIRKAIDYSTIGLNLVFHGGEPFLMVDLMKKLCAFATEYAVSVKKKIYFNVQTNATILKDEVLDFIDAYHLGVGISLDGPGIFNALRIDHTGKQTDKRVWNGIERLQERNHAINIITVITPKNAANLYNIVLEFQKRGITSVKFSPFLAQGYGEQIKKEMTPNPEVVTESFKKIINGIVKGDINKIKVDDICDMINRCLFWQEPNMCHRGGACGAGQDMLAIYPGGDVYACDCLVHENLRLGNINEIESLTDITDGFILDSLKNRNPLMLNPCTNCALSVICGGTMTCRAFWSSGKSHTVEPQECYTNQKTLLRLMWTLTENRRLVEYFFKWQDVRGRE